MQKTIADLFYDNVKKYKDNEAIWCDGESITYGCLADDVSKLSNFLISKGVKYGEHVGIPMNNSIMSVRLMLVAANLGLAIVPINPTLPWEAINTAFQSGEVRHIIARKEFFELQNKQFNVGGMQFCMEGEYENCFSLDQAYEEKPDRPIITEVTGEEPYIITMTSGSTGNPKPICLTQKNKIDRSNAHIELYNLKNEDIILAATPLYHSLAERLVLMPLLLGAKSALMPRFTPLNWLNCVKEQGVTFTIAVSAQLAQIAEVIASPFVPEIETLRCVVSSSSLLEPHVKTELIAKLKCDFHEMYGTSETSTVTDIFFGEYPDKKQSVGKPLKEAKILIIDDQEKEVPKGTVGEIACSSLLMCKGYFNRTDLFEEALTESGYFKTGDLGKIDDDGFLYFAGRKKELIITGGINVYPVDIEKCISSLEEVLECAAFSYPDERLGEVVAVAVVEKEGKEIKKRSIRIQCARNLADYQQPHKIFIIDKLPKNSMGKIVKGKLLEYISEYEAKNCKGDCHE